MVSFENIIRLRCLQVLSEDQALTPLPLLDKKNSTTRGLQVAPADLYSDTSRLLKEKDLKI